MKKVILICVGLVSIGLQGATKKSLDFVQVLPEDQMQLFINIYNLQDECCNCANIEASLRKKDPRNVHSKIYEERQDNHKKMKNFAESLNEKIGEANKKKWFLEILIYRQNKLSAFLKSLEPSAQKK